MRRDRGFGKLYEALAPQLFGLLLRILRRRDLAEEALQDTFVNVWRKASGYRADRGRGTTWIFTIARYRAFDILRRNRRELIVDPETMIGLSDADSAEQQRSSIVMAYSRGHTQAEIARYFEAPLGTVKSWVRRALSSLERCLER